MIYIKFTLAYSILGALIGIACGLAGQIETENLWASALVGAVCLVFVMWQLLSVTVYVARRFYREGRATRPWGR